MDFPSDLFVVKSFEPLPGEDSSDVVVVHVVLGPLVDDQAFDVTEIAEPVTGHWVDVGRGVHWEPPGSLFVVSPFVVSRVVDGGRHVPNATTSGRVNRVLRHIYGLNSKASKGY